MTGNQTSGHQPSSAHGWKYQFTLGDGGEVATEILDGDATAQAHASEISRTRNVPIVVHRHSAHVDAWEYVTEVDERH
jgi:hypothetical protein